LKRFDQQLGELPHGYDHKFTYSHIGYNLKSTDISSALGVSQLAKLDDFIATRKRNFDSLFDMLAGSDALVMPKRLDAAEPAWFGFPLTLRGNWRDSRDGLMKHLADKKIGTRLLFAGNAIRQPAYLDREFRIHGSLESADTIMKSSFWVGVYPGLDETAIQYIGDAVLDFFK